MACVDEKSKHLSLKNREIFKNVIFSTRFNSLIKSPKNPSLPKPYKTLTPSIHPTLLLPEAIIVQILSKLPKSQVNPNSLVCKRWLSLQGCLVRSLKVIDWEFLISGRLVSRFPNLTNVDILQACLIPANYPRVLLNHQIVSASIDSELGTPGFGLDSFCMSVDKIDKALKVIAESYPNLQKLVAIHGGQMGLLTIGKRCHTLIELELHCCSDDSMRKIAACRNLKVLKLIGKVDGVYHRNFVSDFGLTILANGCEGLVKLELRGCEGSLDGIKAIGQCCHMLEKLTLCDHKMAGGLILGLSYCTNLKILTFESCKVIDCSPKANQYLSSCVSLECLYLKKCQLRDRKSLKALFAVCGDVRKIFIEDCWGLDNDKFSTLSSCGKLNLLSLRGCSQLTLEGLEQAILVLNELKCLRVASCKKIEAGEVSMNLVALFSCLQELTWRPDSKLLVSSSLGTGIRRRGTKFFRMR